MSGRPLTIQCGRENEFCCQSKERVMEHKPTYEELAQRVRELEEQVSIGKQAEHELLLTKFSMDVATVSIFWLNEEGSFIYSNDAACEKLGYTCEELLKKNIADVIYGDPFAAHSRADYWQRLKQQGVLSYKSHHFAKNGTIFPISVTAHHLKVDDQQYEFVFAVDISECEQAKKALLVAYDELEVRVQERTEELVKANELLHKEIAERREIEHALRTSEEKFRTVADFTYNWEYWMDPDGNYKYISPSCEPQAAIGLKNSKMIPPCYWTSPMLTIDLGSRNIWPRNLTSNIPVILISGSQPATASNDG